eukprot:m.246241 g.246241  ORF g.246241 m.246241 type:complete len:1354 (-) comp17472_c0_seq1:1616-5677(-)
MGNQLSAPPSQVVALDTYFNELPDYEYLRTLRSTRFLKTAEVLIKNQKYVVKVMPRYDGTDYTNEQEAIITLKTRLKANMHTLTYTEVQARPTFGLLLRPYFFTNLYDRLTTRPLMTPVEKSWIIYQLLQGLAGAHKEGCCHGDIKVDNVLLTSWAWAYWTDFAPFKPVQMPANNPAAFSFFFDTTGRRTCLIAPERFYDSTEATDNELFQDGSLTPAMDMFSFGCLVYEFYTEGMPLFTLADLLAYREGKYQLQHKLDKLSNPDVAALVFKLVCLDPQERLSAPEAMAEFKSSLFPDVFYTTLHDEIHRITKAKTADARVMQLRIQYDILKGLVQSERDAKALACLLGTVVMANVRHLQMTLAKLNALDMLADVSADVDDVYKIDRLVPHLVYMCNKTHVATVRAASVKILTSVLSSVKQVRKPDPALLVLFVLPSLQAFVRPNCPLICRCAYATCLPFLATCGQRMIELAQDQASDSTYSSDIARLKSIIQTEHLNPIVMDHSADVKQAFLTSRLDLLCSFFGPQKTTEVLLSHMMTFLNDKNSWRLRACFFQGAVHVANYVKGQSTVEFIMPLIEKGLSDCEEFVVYHALKALLQLVDLNLLLPVSKRQLVESIFPLSLHPNVWIRQAAVGLISSIGSSLPAYDLHCTWLPQLKPYLRYSITGLSELSVLAVALHPALPRRLYEYIVQANNQDLIFDTLAQTQDGTRDQLSETHLDCFNTLTREGLASYHLKCVLRLEQHLRKTQVERRRLQELLRPGDAQLAPTVSPYRPESNDAVAFVDLLAAQEVPTTPMRSKPMYYKIDFGSTPKAASRGRRAFHPLTTEMSIAKVDGTSVYRCDHDHLMLKKRLMTSAQAVDASYESATPSPQSKRNAAKSDKKASEPAIRSWAPQGVLVANLSEHRARVSHLVSTRNNKFFMSASVDGIIKQWDLNKLTSQVGTNTSVHTLPKQGGPIADLITSSIDDTFVFASGNSLDRLDLEKQQPLFHVNREHAITSLAALPQSWMSWQELLLCADLSNTIEAYDSRIKQGTVLSLHVPEAHGAIESMATSEDGCWFLSSTSRGCITCWDVRFCKPAASWIASENSCLNQLHLYSSPLTDQYQAKPLPKVLAATSDYQWGVWEMSLTLRTRFELLAPTSIDGSATLPLEPKQKQQAAIPPPRTAQQFHAEIIRRELRASEGGKAIDISQAWHDLASDQRTAFYESEHQDYLRYKAAVDDALNKLPTTTSVLDTIKPRSVACNIPGSPFAFIGDPASQITALDLEHPEKSYVVSSPNDQESIFSASYENRLLVVRQATASSSSMDGKPNRSKTGPISPGAAHRTGVTALTVMAGVGYNLLSADAEGVVKVWQ